MKIRSEDILKPGAVMVVEKIDFTDPKVVALFEQTKREQERLKRMRDAPFKNYRITI